MVPSPPARLMPSDQTDLDEVVLVAANGSERDGLAHDAAALRRAGHRLTWVLPEGLGPPQPEEGDRVLHPRAQQQPGLAGTLAAINAPGEGAQPEDRFTFALLRDPTLVSEFNSTPWAGWPAGPPGSDLDGFPSGLTSGPAATEMLDTLVSRALNRPDATDAHILQAFYRAPKGEVSAARAARAAANRFEATGASEPPAEDLAGLAAFALADSSATDAERLLGALSLLFHRHLHAEVESSPLVEDPRSWLADLEADPTWQSWTHRHPDPSPDSGSGGRNRAWAALPEHPRVVVLPGTYGNFSGPVMAALQDAGCQVTTLDLAEIDPLLRRKLPSPAVMQRLSELMAGDSGLAPQVLHTLQQADVVFADWADLPAVWASRLVTDSQRLVLRVHSLDALDPWLHLIDTARVDRLLCVGAPLAELTRRLLGANAPDVAVVPHIVDTERFTPAPHGIPERRLVMVKWGHMVKDPRWSLELLARLRRSDPMWTLRLIGDDFAAGAPLVHRRYAKAFWERANQPDLAGNVEQVPFTQDLPAHLGDCGFVVSSSRRESFQVGLVEAAAMGCVPVVRDWPLFANLAGGASSLMPADWVVESVDEAANRIEQLAERQAYAQATARTREQVLTHFDPHRATTLTTQAILGD